MACLASPHPARQPLPSLIPLSSPQFSVPIILTLNELFHNTNSILDPHLPNTERRVRLFKPAKMNSLPPLSALIVSILPFLLLLPTTAMPIWPSSELALPLQPLLHKLISHPRPLLVSLPESSLPSPTGAELINPALDEEFTAPPNSPGPDSDPEPEAEGIKPLALVRYLPPPPLMQADTDGTSTTPTGPPDDLGPCEEDSDVRTAPEVPYSAPPAPPAPGLTSTTDPLLVIPPNPVLIHFGMPLSPMPPAAPMAPKDAAAKDCLSAVLGALRANSAYLVPASALQWWVFGLSFWLTLCVVAGRWARQRRNLREKLRLQRLRRGGGRLERVCLGPDVLVGTTDTTTNGEEKDAAAFV